MALRSPGSAIPQVASGLLGTYRRRGEMGYTPPGRAGGAGGFSYGGGGMIDTNLTGKYLKDMPSIDIETDPAKLYEQQIGGYRQDVQSAMTQAGQQAISQAAQTGREVADVMARYLPEAVKGFARGAADIAGATSQQAQQGQVAKSELEMKRQTIANEMEMWDRSAQIQQQQFLADLQKQYTLAREQMNNNLRVAQANATNQQQLQSIQNAHAMQMKQMENQFAMQASQYQQAQQNARQSQLLQAYDKWKQGGYNQTQLDQILKGITQIQSATPTAVPGGTPTTQGGTTVGSNYNYNPYNWNYLSGINTNQPMNTWREQMLARNKYYDAISKGTYGYSD